jgi:hypothetical protein
MLNRLGCRAVGARRLLAGSVVAFLVALVLAGIPPSAAANEPTLIAALGGDGPETMVVQITLNGERKGQFFVNVINGAFLARAQDLKAIGLVSVQGRTWAPAGEEYVWVNSISGVAASFDEARLSLDLTVDPKLLPVSTVDLWAGRGEKVVYPDNASAFFNYDIGYAAGNSGFPSGASATTQIGVRGGDFLFLNDSTCSSNSDDHKCVRLTTSLIHDNRDTLVRTIVGDFDAASVLSAHVSMGGISYSKLYDIDPYFIRYPQQRLTGQLRTRRGRPHIDGQRVRTMRLPAGDYDLQHPHRQPAIAMWTSSFAMLSGLSSDQHVVLFGERSLKEGCMNSCYNVGAPRENYGVEQRLWVPRVRRIPSLRRDRFAHARRPRRRQGGSTMPARPPRSCWRGGPSTSQARSENSSHNGGAGLVSYSYLGEHFNAGLLVRKDSPDYAALVILDSTAAITRRRDGRLYRSRLRALSAGSLIHKPTKDRTASPRA